MDAFKRNSLRFIRIFIKRCQKASLVTSSVNIAFYVMLSIFPFLILVGNLLPLFQITPEVVVDYLSIVIPESLIPAVKPIVLSLLNSSGGGLLSVSTVVLLWSSSRATSCVQNSLNNAYGISKDRNYIVRRAIGFVSILLFLALLGALLLLFSFSDMLLSLLEPVFPLLTSLQNLFQNLRWPVVLVIEFIMLMLVFLIAPSAKVRFVEAVPGAVFSTLSLLLLVQLFALYVRVATRSLSGYGALSSFFVLMFWLEYSAMAVVVGALLNASIREYRFGEDSFQASKLDTWNTILDQKLMAFAKKKVYKIKQEKEEHTSHKTSAKTARKNTEDKGGQNE